MYLVVFSMRLEKQMPNPKIHIFKYAGFTTMIFFKSSEQKIEKKLTAWKFTENICQSTFYKLNI